MTYLLDVNVLVSLLDPAHTHHRAAQSWFDTIGYQSWATCPITQNGALRVLTHATYPNAPESFAEIHEQLLIAISLPGHVFWTENLSLLNNSRLDPAYPIRAKHITDIYLLLSAEAHQAQLATFDRRIPIAALRDGTDSLHVIEG